MNKDMPKIITCIAEKPSVAKDIAKVLGCKDVKDGYYEGFSVILDAVTRVTWTFGHLCELKLPHDYNPAWKQWNMQQLPLIPDRFQIKLKPNDGVKHQFRIIKELFNTSDEIINCGDAGQEGELIQRWVLQQTGAKCPVKRLWISSMTDEAIRDGFKHLEDQSKYQHLYEAGLARACGDWLIGMSASRYYTLLGRGHGAQSTLSIGRVQTPTLAMIVKRQEEIDNFVPEDYYVLSTIYRDVVFQATKGSYSDKSEATEDLNAIKKDDFVVTGVTTKKASELPPRLYDLTSLQVDMNKKYGYSAEFTLETLQKLYENKLVTYPRVDTTYLPDDVYGDCPRILRGLTGYTDYVNELNLNKLRKDKKVFDSSKVTDHHAIIPTGKTPSMLSDSEINLYDDIVKHFIAVFYPDCVKSVTTVTGKVGKVEFRATGNQILDIGWYSVFGRSPEGKLLPDFKKGKHGPHKPTLTTRTTTPPPLYTEATLLRAMETAGNEVEDEEMRAAMKANGIGRPSTRAAIIELLFKRGYIAHQKKNIIPTSIGINLIGAVNNPLLKSPELTGQWERKLREIEAGKYPVGSFIDELKDMTYQIVGKKRA
jgi:DNA topoisomerase-3